MPQGWYYFCAVLLLLANGTAWCLTLFSLPGNWVLLACTGLFAWSVRSTMGAGIHWGTVAVLVVLALAGEAIEFLAGAAGAAKSGGSRRGVVLSVVGAMLGSIAGVTIGLPIPILGSAVAAVFGGALGAFAGAIVGEAWKGRPLQAGLPIGRAAFLGRLWGTAGKLAVGVVMWVIATAAAFS